MSAQQPALRLVSRKASRFRRLGLGLAAGTALLALTAQSGFSEGGDGFRAASDAAPHGYLIEGRYADDMIIHIVPREPLPPLADEPRPNIRMF